MATTAASTAAAQCNYYCYDPWQMAQAAFLVVFAQTTLIHVYQVSRAKTLSIVPLIVGGLLEFVGYTTRQVSSIQYPDYTKVPYAIESVVLVVAPTLFAASLYMHHEHVVAATGAETKHPWKMPTFKKVFLIFDAFSFLLQTVGSIMRLVSSTAKWYRLGNRLVMTGLGEQMLFAVIYLCVAAKFQWNVARDPPGRLQEKSNPELGTAPIPYARHLYTLYAGSALIAVRCLVRLLETLQGPAGFIGRHQIFLYIFDAVPMVILMKMFHLVHPSQMEVLAAFYNDPGQSMLNTKGRMPGYFEGLKIWKLKRLAPRDVNSAPPSSTESYEMAVQGRAAPRDIYAERVHRKA